MGNPSSKLGKQDGRPNSILDGSRITSDPSSPNIRPSSSYSYEDDPGITVVVPALAGGSEIEDELKFLQNVKQFLPIIPGSSDAKWVWSKSKAIIPIMNVRAALTICSSYQVLLRKGNKQIVESQRRLAVKVTSTEALTTQAFAKISIHSTDIRSLEFYCKEVDKMEKTVQQINDSLLFIMDSIDRLCQVLPPEESMEPVHSILEKD